MILNGLFCFIVIMLASLSRGCRFAGMKQLLRSSKQVAEWDNPTDIITHCPGLEDKFPFHLDAFLYQRPPCPKEIQECHDKFRSTLAELTDANIWTVRDILERYQADELRRMVVESANIHFQISPTRAHEDLSKVEDMSVRNIEYSLSELDKSHLIDLLLLHPEITINVDNSSTGFSVSEIPISPLSNLIFTRDQQITTANGVVMGRFALPQRRFESYIMKKVWKQLGVEVLATLDRPTSVLEGGDFFPLGEDLCMIGVGLRTNIQAVDWLAKDSEYLGTKRFVIVENPMDLTQERTHLDTVFNVLDEHTCMCLDVVAQDNPNYLRIAREFELVPGKNGHVYVEQLQMPFGKWLKRKGFKIIEVTAEQSKQYFMNVLHLGKDSHGKSKLLATNKGVEDLLKMHEWDGTVYVADFDPITAMFGGVHCATQVFRASETSK